jgi:hypothetical protein
MGGTKGGGPHRKPGGLQKGPDTRAKAQKTSNSSIKKQGASTHPSQQQPKEPKQETSKNTPPKKN